ncbi:MAG TPA: lysylphosphatidylglycerol synthase transmembrane domain-containing protein [Chloroflexota bacterium]
MLVGCAISALAVYFLLQQVSVDQVGQALSRAQIVPTALIVVTVLASLLTRAARWQVYFLPHRRVRYRPLFGTLAISYMASTFLPFRAGELVRAVFLGRREAVAVPSVVGTILLEKLFDFLAIGVMLLVLLAMAMLGLAPLPAAATAAGTLITLVILVGFGFVVALAIWREPTLALVKRVEGQLPVQLAHRLHLEQSARHFAQGTDSLRSGRLWALLLGWTLVTWLCALGSAISGMAALDIEPRLASVLFVVVLTSAGQSVPSSPGYVGVYHAAATFALTTFGVDQATALAFAVLTHAFSYGSLVVVGLIALWTGGYSLSDLLAGVRMAPRRSLNPDPRPPTPA